MFSEEIVEIQRVTHVEYLSAREGNDVKPALVRYTIKNLHLKRLWDQLELDEITLDDFLTRGSKLIQKYPMFSSKGNESSDSEDEDFVDADVIVAEVDLATPADNDGIDEITFVTATIEDTIQVVAPTTKNIEFSEVIVEVANATKPINDAVEVIDLVSTHVNDVIDEVPSGTVDDVVEKTDFPVTTSRIVIERLDVEQIDVVVENNKDVEVELIDEFIDIAIEGVHLMEGAKNESYLAGKTLRTHFFFNFCIAALSSV